LTLRARLTLFFVGIVVLPLVAATLAFQLLSTRQAEVRTNSRLQAGARTVGALWEERLRLVQREVGVAAEDLVGDLGQPDFAARLETIRADAGLDFLVVSDPAGAVLAAAVTPPAFRTGVPPPTPEQIASLTPPTGLLRVRVQVVAETGGSVVTGGRYADRSLATDLADATGLDVAVVSGGTTLAASNGELVAFPQGSSGELPDGPRTLLVSVGGPDDGIMLVARSEEMTPELLWLVALAGLAAATLLGFALASAIARPLERLAEGARAVAGGDLEARVEGGGATDVAGVAGAFNTMTENLRTYIGELESSRDELRRNLDRMGATLRTTLDLEGMLEVVLDTAAVTLGASAAALYLRRASGREISLEVAQGYDPPAHATLPVGHGIAGKAALGAPVLVPGDDSLIPFHPAEPQVSTAVAVPLIRGERTMGVLALYGRTTLEPFDRADAATLAAFGGQASVAIENVLLHQETEQLSITDGLTGVWNRRYLELSLRKEIERAHRFSRPLSLLMIDIDRFKRINDQFGHQRGDEVLVEVTRRIMGTVRTQIDFLSRYGGEEFVVVLPETPAPGAAVVAEKVRAAIGNRGFVGERHPEVLVTVSVGVATYPTDGLSAEELVRAADEALFRAKRAGRDRVEPASA
jgi:two-component system cell cycle response regulator